MKHSIVLGKNVETGKAEHLDLDTLLRTHLLIWASTGGGKSWLIRRIAEQACRSVPVIVVDREGEFQTLRDRHNFLLVGKGGETPADPRSAKMVAETLLRLRASAVCDIFDLKHEARHEWVKNFYEALTEAPRSIRNPAIVILDEAHTFAPEKGQGESIAYGAVTDFNSVARKRRLASICATQRLSKLSKNATAEMYNQAAGPTAQQADRERAAYEMGLASKADKLAFTEQLRTLDPGQFFFQGRAISRDRVLVEVGSVETRHGLDDSRGRRFIAPPVPAKIRKLLPKLADLPKEAEEKAKNEADLRAEIQKLKGEIRQFRIDSQTPKPQIVKPNKKTLKREIARAIAQRDREYKPLFKAIDSYRTTFKRIADSVKFALKVSKIKPPKGYVIDSEWPDVTSEQIVNLKSKPIEIPRAAAQMKEDMRGTQPKARSTTIAEMNVAPHAGNSNGFERKSMKEILDVIGRFELFTPGARPTRGMVATLRGVKATTGSFKWDVNRLKQRGMITETEDGLSLTRAGSAHVDRANIPVDPGEMIAQAERAFGGTAMRILRYLVTLGAGNYQTREAIATHLNLKVQGSFKADLSKLTKAGLLEKNGQTFAAAQRMFF